MTVSAMYPVSKKTNDRNSPDRKMLKPTSEKFFWNTERKFLFKRSALYLTF